MNSNIETSLYSYLPNSYSDERLKIGASVLDQIKRRTVKNRQNKRNQYDRIKGARSGWQVHKFGGSTFADSDAYSFVAGLIDSFNGKNLVVVSAMNGITNVLYSVCERAKSGNVSHSIEWQTLTSRISGAIVTRLGNSIYGEKEMQRFATDLIYLAGVLSHMPGATFENQQHITSVVVGYGEIWSARLLTAIMRSDFLRSAAFMDARDVLVVEPTGDDDETIDVSWNVSRSKLKTWWTNRKHCDVLIVTGFIARTLSEDLPTTLKRNGSDFSATIFSVLSKAHSVTVWKDVNGMYSSDPKKNPDAVFIPYQTFEEAEEASLRGAFVLQKDCIAPARQHNIPIYLRNCFNLSCLGTRIGPPEDCQTTVTRSRDFGGISGDEECVFFMDEGCSSVIVDHNTEIDGVLVTDDADGTVCSEFPDLVLSSTVDDGSLFL